MNDGGVHCDLALLADSAVEAKDGKISAIGIFDRVETTSLPFTLESALHLVRLRGESGKEIGLEQKIVSPASQELASVHSGVRLDRFGVANVLAGIKGLILDQEGRYSFQSFFDGSLISTASLHVTVVQEIEESG